MFKFHNILNFSFNILFPFSFYIYIYVQIVQKSKELWLEDVCVR